MAVVVAFPARNKLAYPAGTRAGIDPSHPAARNCVAAVINVYGNYIDLIDGRFGTTVHAVAPTVGIDGIIGPNSSFTANNNFTYKFAGPGIQQAAWTIASIFNFTVNGGSGIYQTLGAIGANGVGGFWLKNGLLVFYNNNDNVSTFSLTVGQSYFVVMSGVNTLAAPIYMAAKNLGTGQVQTCTLAMGGAPSTPIDDFFLFGNDGSGATGEFANCKIAAAMYSPILLSMPQLLQWAADPWAFWYPPQARSRFAGGLFYLRPDADSIDGGWTNELGGTVLFSSIDELTADDTDYIRSSVNPSADIAKISLSNPATSVGSPVKLRYRYKKSASATANLAVRLLQGTTEIAAWTHSDISSSFVTTEQTLSAPQLASITDFTDLYIEVTASS